MAISSAGADARPTPLVQPVTAGVLAAVVGYASSFAVVLQGLAAAGASPAQAASGLFALCLVQGLLAIVIGLRTRQPISFAWSTPGAALLVTTGAPDGGFAVAVTAFLLTAALVVVAGLWRAFGRAVAAIPLPLANAMLAGVLLDLCLAPVRAVAQLPALALPVVLAWALGWRFARRYAVLLAVLVAAVAVVATTPIPAAALELLWPRPVFVVPGADFAQALGIAIPLFIVTMASQNVPGLAVLRSHGYTPQVGPLFTATGVASALSAPFGGHVVNLSAITAALCAGPEAGADPRRRYVASVSAGVAYLALGVSAGFAAAFIAASPPLLIQAVAGLALLTSLGAALAGALELERMRLAAVATFVTTVSGISVGGIGAAFWGLVAGGAVLLLERRARA